MDRKKAKRNPPSIKEKVYFHIRNKIIKSDILGGEFIEEEEVTDELGVSRTPVREAFSRLEAERFIDLIPRKGARVRQITGQEIIDIYETRRLIEIHAAMRICKEKIDVPPAMYTYHEAMIVDTHDIDFYEHIINDSGFHGAMVDAIGNPVISDVYKSIQERKMRVAYTALSIRPDRLSVVTEQHQKIIAALANHDTDEVASLLEKHLLPVEGVISRLPK
ncbi:GntR family transcriptional regulator [Halomonas sp. HMF6819]|uniref:GntR family transcriptional regulator n=1 Tax=unclassified Halomonas TaxID=2609666 RepID=UPI0020769CA5|nr:MULTISPECIES: GntR family transcriptional regulator [unclassified Halomonas]